MHKRLIEEGFNRRYVLPPLLLSIALVVLGFSVTEARRNQTRELADMLRERQDVIRLLGETTYKTLEAESAQRGFLLTGEAKYLAPFDAGLVDARARLGDLLLHYTKLAPEELPVLQQISEDLRVKAQEMRQSVTLLKDGRPRTALALVKSDVGLNRMTAIGEALESLRMRERERVLAGLNQWGEALRINAAINVFSMVFTIVVLVVLGLLVTRDIRRREGFAADLAAQIDVRTSELSDLSRHMSRVAETEKHALARELHDELGGLLVAMRMDIAQIRKRLGPTTDADLQARWERVEQALGAGVELKRRVIEDLRPTLLDNMGLFTALRWLAQQRCEQAQLYLRMDGLDEDIDVPPETAIAVFRTAQEAIANVIKHSGAKRIIMKAEVGDELSLQIADDGRGLPRDAETRVGSHGLKQMRFRMEAVGGSLRFETNEVGGTTVILSASLS